MNNTKLYPFERNCYYSGKMLTSADFQAEQAYFNNKRRFINNLMYGSGGVCGYGVFTLDDLSLLVESGVAIDGLGREIVMESSVVKKLSAIEGFESLKTDTASLCLRYKEEPVHTVYAVNQSGAEDGQEYKYNRISESYQLFLMDKDAAEEEYQMEGEFLTSATLFEDDDFSVKLIMPANVCKGRNVKLVVQADKLSSGNKKLSYRCILQTPAFLNAKGEQELEIELDDISLANGESIRREYWLSTQDASMPDTTILLKSGTAKAYINDAPVEAVSACSMKIMVTDRNPRELVNREIGRMSLEMRNMGAVRDYIPLADLKLVRTENAYIIEEILENGVKSYITAPAQEMLRGEYLDYFVKEPEIFHAAGLSDVKYQSQSIPQSRNRTPEVATGVLEIPLGEAARRGDIRYSGEIIHGLGRGNVYVDIGYEYIVEDPALESASKNTIYGNPELFRSERTAAVDAETAVQVMNDKGSFIVAARLLENVDYLVLTYRWVAI